MSWCTSGVGLQVNYAFYRQSTFVKHPSLQAILLYLIH